MIPLDALERAGTPPIANDERESSQCVWVPFSSDAIPPKNNYNWRLAVNRRAGSF
jgi:hypothetical protein